MAAPHLHTALLPHPDHPGIDHYSVAVLTDVGSLSDLLAETRRLADERDGRTFVTLDDVAQCEYTSGHAVNGHDLDAGVEYPEDDSADALRAYEAARFAAVLASLRASDSPVQWDGIPEEFATVEEDIDALVRLNRNPDVLLEDAHVVQSVPEPGVDGLLANLPNGYFSGDWTPFQSLAVTRRLHDAHGYEPLGIGARTLAFHRPEGAPGSDRTASLICDLQHLYGHADREAWTDLAQTLSATDVLILGYTEDFAEIAE